MTRRFLDEASFTFRSLRSRNFRLFFAGQGISQAGTWMQMIATGILVLRLTHSGVAVGLSLAAQMGPVLILGAWAGVMTDRVDRHRWLLGTQVAGGVVAAAMAALVLGGWEELWSVFVLTAMAGTVTALENPARRAFVVDLVSEDEVANAVGLNSALMTGARVVGPAIGGVLIAGPGIAWCFALNALTYIPQVLLFARMDRSRFRPHERVAKAKGQLREGLRYAWGDPELRLPLLLVTAVGTLAFNFSVVLPLFATRDLEGGDATVGWLFSVMSLGSVIGALAVARRTSADTAFLARATLVMGVSICLFAVAPTVPLAYLLSVPVGVTSIYVISGMNAVVQLRAIPSMRGRVLALTAVVFLGSTPIGGPIVGWISEELGARAGLAVGGVTCLVAGALVLRTLRIHGRAAGPAVSPEAMLVR